MFIFKNITDESMISVAQNCESLRHLCISHCKHLTDVTLVALGKHCYDLEIFESSGCSNFSDVGFAALSKVSSSNFACIDL